MQNSNKYIQEHTLLLISYKVYLDLIFYKTEEYRLYLNYALHGCNLEDKIISLDIDILSNKYFYKEV